MKIKFIKINRRIKEMANILASSFIFISLILAPFSPLVGKAEAVFNKQINYQGKLTTSAGVAVANGTYNMEFKLYDAPTAGTTLWTETRTTTNKVQVTNGLFSVLLGEVNALTGVDFNQTLYLGVNIGGTGTPGWDGEMTPRKKLGAVPAAVVSETAQTSITSNITNDATTSTAVYPTWVTTNSGGMLIKTSSAQLSFIPSSGSLTVSGYVYTPNVDAPSAVALNLGTVNQSSLTLGRVGANTTINGAVVNINSNATSALNITTGTTGALTLDTGTTGTINIGTNANAKIINIGTGAVANTITIGSASATGVSIADNNWSVTTAGAGTFASLNDAGLTASKVVFTDASKNLTSTGIGTASQFIKADGSLDSTVYGTGSGDVSWGGNTNGAKKLIGSNDTYDIGFKTNGTEKLTILSGGNVGIGNTNPGAALDIATTAGRDLVFSGITYNADLSVTGANTLFGISTNGGDIHIGTTLDASDLNLKNHKIGIGTATPTSSFQVAQATTGTGTVATNGTITLTGTGTQFTNTFKVGDTITVSGETVRTIATIPTDTSLTVTVAFSTTASSLSYTLVGGNRFAVLGNGNVGIGTTGPNSLLHLQGSSTQILTIGNSDTTSGAITGTLRFQTGNGNHQWAGISGIKTNTVSDQNALAFYTTPGGSVAATERMRIDNVGNVGIGTTNPLQKLQVSGDMVYTQSQSGQLYISGATTPNKRLMLGYDTTNNFGFIEGINFGTAYSNVIINPYSGNVGIGTTNPGYKLDVNGTANIGSTLTLTTAPTTSAGGYDIMTRNTSTGVIEKIASSSLLTSLRLDQITAANTTATIDSLTNAIAWNWSTATTQNPFSMSANGLTTGSLLTLSSNGTAALTGEKGLNISLSGVNGTGAQTTYGAYISNTHSGTSNNVGLYSTATGGSNNYAAIFDQGYVGIGTVTPGTALDVTGTGRFSAGLTLTTGALNLTATSGALALSGLSSSSINTGTNALTITSGTGASTFNTTATGINATQIGATTPASGAFTTVNGLYLSLGASSINTNIAIGYTALNSNTTGYKNTAIGYESLNHNTGGGLGNSNTAIGYRSLYSNIAAGGNVAVGATALTSNISGQNLSALGSSALSSNTTAYYNTAVGTASLFSTTIGWSNTAIGNYALWNNISGGSNIAIGSNAGATITGGSTALTTPSNSIFIGTSSMALADSGTNEIVIGYNAIGNGSNSVTLGNTSITTTVLQGSVGIGNTNPSTYNLQVTGTGGFTTSVNSPIFQGQATATTLGNASYNTAITSNVWGITGAGVASGLTGITTSNALTLTTAPTTSAGTYDIITRNSSTGVVEKVPTSTFLTSSSGVSSISGTANQISASSSTGAVTLSIPSDFRAPGTLNAVTSIATGAGAGTVRIDASGNLTNIASVSSTTAATALSITTGTTGALTLDSGTTGAINIGTNANAKTISIGTGAVANTITIGSASATGVSITDNNWSVTAAGSATFTGAVIAGLNVVGSSNNTGLGNQALFSRTSGDYNTGVGLSSLYYISTGSNNTALGANTLVNYNTSNNTAVGTQSMYFTSGSNNTAVGNNSLYYNSGSNNVAIGNEAAYYTVDGSYMSRIFSNSVYIGSGTRGFSNSDSNSIVIGYNAYGRGANTAVWGNTSITDHYFTGNLNLSGTATRTIQMERNSTAATAGQGLTLSSGGAIAGTADLNGGDLILKSGISTGTGSSDIHFYTATAGTTGITDRTPTEKMAILGNGNVGIGTTTPGYPLQVNGIIAGSGYFINSGGTGDVHLGNSSNGEYLNILNGGSVGIGTTNPGGKLEVSTANSAYNDVNGLGSFIISNNSDINKHLYFGYDTTLGTNGSGWIQSIRSTVAYTNLLLNPNGGNVGIGTVAPNAKTEILSTTEQLRLSYDATHYASFTTGSGGSLTLGGTTGYLTANKLITSGGASSQFVKGDGSLDGTTYLTSASGVSSIVQTTNQISASSSTGAVTLSIPSDFRAPGTLNAVTSIATGAGAGTVRIDASGNLTNIGTISSGLINSQTISSTANFTGTVNVSTGLTVDTNLIVGDATNNRVYIGAATEGTSSSKLYVTGTTAANGATSAIAGILGGYTFNPTAGGTQVGDRYVVTNSPTTNANTAVAQMVRVVDNTSLSNTVRGLDITANGGSNTAGTNTGLRAAGATFGVQGVISGLGGGVSVPAALYGESTGTTQGDILRLYSTSVTSATSYANFFHSTSTFTGTGLLMKFATGSGSFTGNFIDLQKNNVSVFKVTNAGVTSLGLSGTASTTAVCSSLANGTAPTAGTSYELRDCSGAPVADYAEMYPVTSGIEYGDIVSTGTEKITTYDIGTDGNIDWNKVKGNVTKLVKSTDGYQQNVVGIVSNNKNDFSSTGYNIKDTDNPMPVALNGRVPVKISPSSSPIKAGDYLTTSQVDPGMATRALRSGFVIGKALEDWTPSSSQNMVMVFVEQGYYESDGAHQFAGESTFNGLTFFNANVDFAKSVKFEDVAEFAVPPLFNSDTAGFAVVKAGANKVDVTFDNSYIATPIVNTTVSFEKVKNADGTTAIFDAKAFFDNDIKSVVADKDEKGFSIVLNKVAPQDVRFSWIALAVKNPKVFESVINGLVIEPTSTPTNLAQQITSPNSTTVTAPTVNTSTTPTTVADTSSTDSTSSSADTSTSTQTASAAGSGTGIIGTIIDALTGGTSATNTSLTGSIPTSSQTTATTTSVVDTTTSTTSVTTSASTTTDTSTTTVAPSV